MIDTITFRALIGDWNYGDDPNQHLPGHEKPEQAKQDVCCQFDKWKKENKPEILDIIWGRKYDHGSGGWGSAGSGPWDFWQIKVLYEKEKK